MTKKSRRKRPKRSAHVYRHGQQPDQWLVPLTGDGHACIYHGHEDPQDHSLCGPQIFCCHKAAVQFMKQYPDVLPADVALRPMSPPELLAWDAPEVFYVYFCDPVNRQRVYFQGVTRSHLSAVLHFQVSLEDHVVGAQVVA